MIPDVHAGSGDATCFYDMKIFASSGFGGFSALQLWAQEFFKAGLLPSMHDEVHRSDLASQAALPRRMA